MVALPAVVIARNAVEPPLLLVMTALPAVAVSVPAATPNTVAPLLSLVMAMLLAELRVEESRRGETERADVGNRGDTGGIGIDDVEGAFVGDGADDAAGRGERTELQCGAVADRGAAAVGIGVGENQGAAAEVSSTVSAPVPLTTPENVSDMPLVSIALP